ncbi:MAG: hypothetical protein KH415_18190 [Clostridium sp.]|nr:hypothetical protein [Clostridium sp.]
MDKEKFIGFINKQIEDVIKKIRDLEYEDYDHENIHKTIDFYGQLNKLKGSKEALITIKRIVENI